MSPDAKAKRLLDVVNEIDSIRALVDVADMAASDLLAEHRDPLPELLRLISQRLRTVSEDLVPKQPDQAA